MKYLVNRSGFFRLLSAALIGGVVSSATAAAQAQAQDPAPSRIGGRAATRPNGTIVLFARGTSNMLNFGERVGFNGVGWNAWDAWYSLGGFLTSEPVALIHADGRLLVSARGSDHRIYQRSEVTAGSKSFHEWTQIPHLDGAGATLPDFVGDPALVRTGNGRISLFAVAVDGTCWQSTQTSSSSSFGRYVALGKPAPLLAGRSPVVSLSANGGLMLFATARDKTLWFRMQQFQGGSWGAWTSLAGSVSLNSDAVFTGINSNGRVSVFMNNTASTLSYRTQTATNSASFTGWANVLGGAHGRTRPTVARNANGRLSVFFWSSTGGEYAPLAWNSQTAASGTSWTNWSTIDSAVISPPIAITDAVGKIHLIALGHGNYIHETVQTAPNATTWTDWTSGYFGGPFASL